MDTNELDRLNETIQKLITIGYAYSIISNRADEAHEYCRKYSLPLGKNIWHAILDDAIRMRKEIEDNKK